MEKNQLQAYRVLLEGGMGEIIEKKSRFIATIKPVETEEEAIAFIEEIKKKYWDARHNCSAFVIGSRGELTRCSDDGEPSGTAGRPMLEVLLGEGVRNIAVVVTRYFGGVLLGTGGLVRAYTQAVKEGLEACAIGTMVHGYEVILNTDYNGIGKVLYLLGQYGIEPTDSDYGTGVTLQIQIADEFAEKLKKELVEATSGKIGWEVLDELFFVQKDKK